MFLFLPSNSVIGLAWRVYNNENRGKQEMNVGRSMPHFLRATEAFWRAAFGLDTLTFLPEDRRRGGAEEPDAGTSPRTTSALMILPSVITYARCTMLRSSR